MRFVTGIALLLAAAHGPEASVLDTFVSVTVPRDVASTTEFSRCYTSISGDKALVSAASRVHLGSDEPAIKYVLETTTKDVRDQVEERLRACAAPEETAAAAAAAVEAEEAAGRAEQDAAKGDERSLVSRMRERAKEAARARMGARRGSTAERVGKALGKATESAAKVAQLAQERREAMRNKKQDGSSGGPGAGSKGPKSVSAIVGKLKSDIRQLRARRDAEQDAGKKTQLSAELARKESLAERMAARAGEGEGGKVGPAGAMDAMRTRVDAARDRMRKRGGKPSGPPTGGASVQDEVGDFFRNTASESEIGDKLRKVSPMAAKEIRDFIAAEKAAAAARGSDTPVPYAAIAGKYIAGLKDRLVGSRANKDAQTAEARNRERLQAVHEANVKRASEMQKQQHEDL